MVSNESIRRWVLKFGPIIAKNLRAIRPKPHSRWHLDEIMVSIAGRQMYVWRAVDSEGEVLEILVQPQRDKAAALRLLRKLLRRQGFVPTGQSASRSIDCCGQTPNATALHLAVHIVLSLDARE
jgi:putative transposase